MHDIDLDTYILDRYGHARSRRRASALRVESRLYNILIPLCHERDISNFQGAVRVVISSLVDRIEECVAC